MKNINILMEEFKGNFEKLEKATKEQTKVEQKERTLRAEQTENFYKLEDKKINSQEYLTKHEEIKKELEKVKAKNELLLIEKKLLQDNENIIADKIIIDIFKNILFKYEGKNIGEATAQKIDGEVKGHIHDIFSKKYFEIYAYNTFRNYQPNQFVNIWGAEYSFSNYQKKLCFNLVSHYGARNDYKQNIYIINGALSLDEYSKTPEEIEENNKKHIETIESNEIIQDTKTKAKEIQKAYNKKIATLEKLRKQQEQAKNEFDDTIKASNGRFLHHLYNYFNG